jgi:hypothetical protein
MNKNFKQAYQQKPWRLQIQRFGMVLLLLAILILSFFLNLNFTSRTAKAGVSIRILEGQRETLIRAINAKNTDLAMLTSTTTMQARAEELGFVPATRSDIEYVYIPEYIGKQPKEIAMPRYVNDLNTFQMIPAFTSSIWDWLYQGTFIRLDKNGQ